MKKLILLLALAITGTIHAQIPVTDVATNGQLGLLNTTTASSYGKMAEQVVTAAKQLSQLEKTYNTVKATAEKVEKVSDAVQSYNDVDKFISKQKEIIKNVGLVTNSKKSTIPRNQLQNILNTSSSSIKKIQEFLSDNVFNMNDKERIDLVTAENKKLELSLMRSRMYANSVK
ncbi:hypothetical protein B0A67_24475 [Flavobacterium aquidurense]|uniref:hypothetical protein n=1 Tax=Flavobacterium aquidurense TaxID=362413 RepID=UPI00091289D9|nr:hypothetical protein [Flavobacterium aquidurense]OXA65326.1 hypothetical protein B0A67_24475 [Flavobacterium aquidurense]SHH86691.1 hypothetical protein SAMN05444481_13614 [Flavobacterium frigidimaris]